ncbi:hypothetical protein [Plantactinospora sp. B5E13]|uniref:hypothetical protein n=1 Tax=unclassified Plantactinospora TaxID=2631981 RepID=UPI00325CF1C7
MTLYWDPTTAMRPEQRVGFDGRWEELLWLNVPGPFWTGQTDNCWTGRLHAPSNVLYGGEYVTEFVFRQPRTPAEVNALLDAAWEDPYGGYGCDGDDRWTPATVRAWWRERGRVREHLDDLLPRWSAGRAEEQEAAEGLRDFRSYLAGPLATDLRRYLFWLEERRSPTPVDVLPDL